MRIATVGHDGQGNLIQHCLVCRELHGLKLAITGLSGTAKLHGSAGHTVCETTCTRHRIERDVPSVKYVYLYQTESARWPGNLRSSGRVARWSDQCTVHL